MQQDGLQERDQLDSELGKLSHWESVYKQEIDNYVDHGDVGEIWYSFLFYLKFLNKV